MVWHCTLKKTKFTVFHSPSQIIPWDEINLVIDENNPNCSKYDLDLKKNSDIPAVKFLEYILIQHYHLNIVLTNLTLTCFFLEGQKIF